MRAQVPFRLLKSFHKIQQRLVRELEKKFSGKDVVLIANRRIMRPVTTGRSNDRPRSRTLTAVGHHANPVHYLPCLLNASHVDGVHWGILVWQQTVCWASLCFEVRIDGNLTSPMHVR